ncbi:spleen trypsin inhibitor I-like [Ovis canadensis]|uniref:spleen trypsin inhibitor I-like n=1 Tax=Ovis canadensis TaxID=37174 RepID=UPI003751475F
MHRLCLSAALLVLLVILVDGTTNDTNKSRDHGLEINHGRGPKKHSLKRIVSKIFDGVHKASSRPSICLDPAFPGPCHKQKMRYFYNAKTRRCEVFIYGGCRGNKNRFRTEKGCKKICGEGIVSP